MSGKQNPSKLPIQPKPPEIQKNTPGNPKVSSEEKNPDRKISSEENSFSEDELREKEEQIASEQRMILMFRQMMEINNKQ